MGTSNHSDRGSIRKEDATHDEYAAAHNEERAVALALARQADPGPKMLSLRSLQLGFYVLVCCMCGGDSGFDGTIMGSVNSMTQFQSYFGLSNTQGASKTSILFGIYTVGQVVSFFPGSYLPDRIGRRWTMFIGNIVLVAGALIGAFATSMSMLLGGRFLVGLGCSTAAVSAKSYVSEIASPWNRGKWMGILNSFYYIGQILASGVSIPLGRRASDWSWRAPLLLQCMLAVVNLVFVMFLPESPRWLYSRGHREKAVDILAKLHSRDQDPQSPLVQMEIAEFEESISLEGADKRFWDFRPLVTTRSGRYRAFLCVIVSCWGQLSGNGLITYFLPMLLDAAGITNRDRQRVLNFVNSVTSFIGALVGTAVVDRVGRRTLMLTAAVSCTIGMAIVAGLLSDAGEQSNMRANAGISFIFLFMVFFSFGWTPLQGLYPAECLAFEVRAKGLAAQGLFTNTFSLINTFGLPPALAALGWKTYLIFMCWDVVGVGTIYTWAVETKQMSLEELDEVFEDKNPKKKSFALAAEAKKRARQEREAVRAAGLRV